MLYLIRNLTLCSSLTLYYPDQFGWNCIIIAMEFGRGVFDKMEKKEGIIIYDFMILKGD